MWQKKRRKKKIRSAGSSIITTTTIATAIFTGCSQTLLFDLKNRSRDRFHCLSKSTTFFPQNPKTFWVFANAIFYSEKSVPGPISLSLQINNFFLPKTCRKKLDSIENSEGFSKEILKKKNWTGLTRLLAIVSNIFGDFGGPKKRTCPRAFFFLLKFCC